MSQHPFTTTDGSGVQVRTSLTEGLQALASNSSGDTAPSTTYAHQWWFQPSTGVLWQRNATDDAWVRVGLVDSDGFYPARRGQEVGRPGELTSDTSDEVDWDLAVAQVGNLELGDDYTLNAASNAKRGAIYRLRVDHVVTGGATLTFAAAYDFGAAGTPTLSTTPGLSDVLTFLAPADGGGLYALDVALGFTTP